jgi:Zinc-finger of C2H2 type
MLQMIVEGLGEAHTLIFNEKDYGKDVAKLTLDDVQIFRKVAEYFRVPETVFYLITRGGKWISRYDKASALDLQKISLCLRIRGGIDFQHREGSKIGSGGQLSESQAAVERRERLRKLALETIDISKDPYFMRNHLGSYECKLCLTLHTNEGNYLAHTQGKRHQSNLARRAAMEAKASAPQLLTAKTVPRKRAIKIGRPGYKVRKN